MPRTIRALRNVPRAINPPPPTLVVAGLQALTDITVSWQYAYPNTDNYPVVSVWRIKDSGTPVFLGEVGPSAFVYPDLGLTNGVYRYRVYGGHYLSSESYTESEDVTVLSELPTPTSFAGDNGDNGVDLSWSYSFMFITGFTIQRKLTSDGAGSFADITGSPAGSIARTFTDTDVLSPSTSYDWRIRAFDGLGNVSQWSSTVTVVTTAPPAPPDAPTSPSATELSSSQIRVDWTPSATAGATTYVEKSLTGSGGWSNVAGTPFAPGVATCIAASLAANTQYFFRLKANTAAGGDSSYTSNVNATTEPASGQTVVVFPDDFTYRGAFRVNNATSVAGVGSGEARYGKGLSVKYEALDVGNEFHLMSTGYGGVNFGVYEYRVPNPATWVINPPGSYLLSQYPQANPIKSYSTKPYYDSGGTRHFTNDYLDGTHGLRWDPVQQKLIYFFHNGYNATDAVNASGYWGYSTLDYAGSTAGLAVADGWLYRTNNQGPKGLYTGIMIAPSAYADAYLGGNDLIMGWGGYFSIIGTGDVSLGPSLTVIPRAFYNDAPGTHYAGTPLLGYWPFIVAPASGYGRSVRMAEPDPYGYVYNPVNDAWAGYWDWNDRCRAGAMIYTTNKRGFIFFGVSGHYETSYLGSIIPSIYWRHWVSVYDPHDATPISGTPRQDIQPAQVNCFEFPGVNYTEQRYTAPPPSAFKPITSITSDPTKRWNAQAGCLVHCPNHGITVGTGIRFGSSAVDQYNNLWNVINTANTGGTTSGAGSLILTKASAFGSNTDGIDWSGIIIRVTGGTNFVPGDYIVDHKIDGSNVQLTASPTPSGAGASGAFTITAIIDADHLYIRNSSSSTFWVGTTDNSGLGTVLQYTSTVEEVIGADFDPVTNYLFVKINKSGTTSSSGQPLVMVWELTNP